MKELDGVLLQGPLELDPSSNARSVIETVDALTQKMSFEDLFYSIILIEGIWKIGDRNMTGQISINNAPNWRKMYLDIEVDADTRVEGDDFADVILQSRDMGEGFVRRFIEVVSDRKNELARLTSICFFDGPVSRKEIYNAKSVYYPTIADYLSDAFLSYKTELDEAKEKSLLSGLSPYRPQFLISSLMKNVKFRNILQSDLIQAEILQVKGNSVLFLGKKKDSFHRAYEMLKKDTFEKMAKGLRPEESVRREIDTALGGSRQTDFDEDAVQDSFENPDDDSADDS